LQLADMFPDFLLQDPALLVVYTYLIRRVRSVPTKIIAGGKVVALAGYEICESFDEMSQRTGQGVPAITVAIKTLETLDLIESRMEDGLYRIRFKCLSLWAQDSGQRSPDIREYNDCTFDEFVLAYLEYVATNLSVKTRQNASRVMGLFSDFLGKKKLSELRGEDLENFKRSRKGKVKDSTINIDIRSLKAALQVAVTLGRINSNPFRPVKLIRLTKKPIKPLTHGEFISLCRLIKEPWLVDLVKFAVLTGLRRGELMDLKWEHVDLDRREISIESSNEYRVKHGKTRRVPLGDEALSILEMRRGCGKWVFVDDGGERLRDEFVSKRVKSYMRELGLPEELHFHSLRATCASWGLREGMSETAIRDLLGHSSIKVTETYASLDSSALRKEAQKITLPSAA
jgi:integrase